MMARTTQLILVMLCTLLGACKGEEKPVSEPILAINEVVSSNDGVNIDESGQTEDWFELVNTSQTLINLRDFAVADDKSDYIPLPDHELAPGAVVVFWADDQPQEGPFHLPFKLSADGDRLRLRNNKGEIVTTSEIPSLETNQSYARFPDGTGDFALCRYASPNKVNGNKCQSNATPTVSESIEFDDFATENWPPFTAGIGINELALFPAQYIEVRNFSSRPAPLDGYKLVFAPYPPQSGLPAADHPSAVDLPDFLLPSSEVLAVDISAAVTEAIANQPFQEGVVVLYNRTGQALDFVPFMHWPDSATLSRDSQSPFRPQFCLNQTPNAENQCEPLPSREIGNRTRGLYTPGDFAALANGTAKSNIQSVKFIIDLENDKALHFPAAREWPLHYTFVREVIDQDPPLDRCDATESREFNAGWGQFSQINYSSSVTRRYHLGTLSKHANAGLDNVEYTFGDAITADQMREAFFQVTAATLNPLDWSLRPQDNSQVNRVRSIEGTLPIVGPNAPFNHLVFQGLTSGVAYGTLTFVPTDELPSATLGKRVIVITNDVPNDIDFVAGLITEAFQTPLAHVNLLSQSRNTPNMALPKASEHPDIQPLLDKLVRLEVNDGGYTLTAATLAEAQTFWANQEGETEVLEPRLDRSTNFLVDLSQADIHDIPTIGAKAAQLAEVMSLNPAISQCGDAHFAVPEGAFAIPMHFYLRHMNTSGAQDYLDTLLQDDDFLNDLAYRKIALQSVQQMILQHPVESTLLSEVEAWVYDRFGNKRVRFRSSSNTEDLQEFNGAGLYTSISAELDDNDRPVDVAIRTVWASLWNPRAFEERLYSNVDQTEVAMAVLVHQAFTNERVNGVAVARNILSPLRTDQYYVNSQAGEASVTNPAPGVVTEQLIYQWPPRTPLLTYQSYSNLRDQRVMTTTEIRALACSMSAVQNHFKELLDPYHEDRWFTMESEFKLLGEERTLLIKQARPFKLIEQDIPNDCREDI